MKGASFSPPITDKKNRHEKFAVIVMGILVVYAAVRNLFDAASKPFWLDELLTLIVARQPSVSAIWKTLAGVKDGQPPPFYIVEHAAGTLLHSPEISYRLPSILGFAVTLICVFLFVRRRSSPFYGVLCAAILLLTTAYSTYATEARPYSLLVAFIAIALLCYQHAPETGWMILMACSFAAAEALHYYAVFALVPFALAEIALYLRARQLRLGVWLAMVCGFVPLVPFLPLLRSLKESYVPESYNRPTLLRAGTTYGWFFHVPYDHWSRHWDVALAVVAVSLVVAIGFASIVSGRLRRAYLKNALFHEYVLVVALLGLPFIIWMGTELSHGLMSHRYALPALLAFSAGCGYILPRLKSTIVVLLVILVSCILARQEIHFWAPQDGHLGQLQSPVTSVEHLANLADRPSLPIVVSDAAEYMEIIYYASPEWKNRLIAVVDPPQARIYMGTDDMDLGLSELRAFFPMNVFEFRTFVADHPTFLLYSGGGFWDWWPRRLARDGDELSLLAEEQGQKIYLVKLTSSASAQRRGP